TMRGNRWLGSGTYGGIVHGRTKDGIPVAVKVICFTKKNKQDTDIGVDKEVDFLKKSQGEGVIKYYGKVKTKNAYYLVTELGKYGDFEKLYSDFFDDKKLEKILKNENCSKLDLKKYYLNYMLKAIGRIHKKGIIHNDLKLSNILIRKDRRPLICDFGGAGLEIFLNKMIFNIRGTFIFLPPEKAGRIFYACFSFPNWVLTEAKVKKNYKMMGNKKLFKCIICYKKWLEKKFEKLKEIIFKTEKLGKSKNPKDLKLRAKYIKNLYKLSKNIRELEKTKKKKKNVIKIVRDVFCSSINMDTVIPSETEIIKNAEKLMNELGLRNLAAEYALKTYKSAKQLDLWALGMTFLLILHEWMPQKYNNIGKVTQNMYINMLFNVIKIHYLHERKTINKISNVKDKNEAEDFINKFFAKEPKDRYQSTKEVRNHAFLEKLKIDDKKFDEIWKKRDKK
ncbi:protein kinase family protein, partial [Candidatus Margulisiibacteriota bacterium]